MLQTTAANPPRRGCTKDEATMACAVPSTAHARLKPTKQVARARAGRHSTPNYICHHTCSIPHGRPRASSASLQCLHPAVQLQYTRSSFSEQHWLTRWDSTPAQEAHSRLLLRLCCSHRTELHRCLNESPRYTSCNSCMHTIGLRVPSLQRRCGIHSRSVAQQARGCAAHGASATHTVTHQHTADLN